MDKGAIERFAIASRVKLRNSVSLKMTELGANPDYPMKVDVVGNYVVLTDPKNGIERHLSSDEAKARDKLLQVVSNNGFDNVVESVAYTWFNRLIAIRYMEVNNYLPSHIRVLSSITPGKKEPDLVTQCLSVSFNLSSSEKETIMKLQNENRSDDLFRLMFLFQCRELNAILPELFTKTNHYENLLFDISYTNPEGVVRDLVDNIPEEDFKDAVQIIGWMYQYYNTELKDDTFAQLKKNVKISKERIPSATQLFTPDWIVRYMVENSVGRIWLDGHLDDNLKSGWKYYLDEAEQEPEVQQQLSSIRKERSKMSPEDITIIDPCMGSGHILVYAFDVLMQIYESYGYSKEDAAILIIEKNLYGLDIDDRAYQLAYFAIMMKARQYNNKVLESNIVCNLLPIPDSSNIDDNVIDNYTVDLSSIDANVAHEDLKYLLNQFKRGKNIGSLLKIKTLNYELMMSYLKGRTLYLYSNADNHSILKNMVKVAKIMSNNYCVVVTNPPYMGASGMNTELSDYVKETYPKSKSDLSTCFMERAFDYCLDSGFVSMINIPVWMYLVSYEQLRLELKKKDVLINMVHHGRGIFGSDFGSTSFVYQKIAIPGYRTTFCKLFEKSVSVDSIESKESKYLSKIGRHYQQVEIFDHIPSMPFAYWFSKELFNSFDKGKPINEIACPRQGLATADNDRFLRYWYEVPYSNISFDCHSRSDSIMSKKRWFPYNKGGKNRKWYGNNDYVVNWENDGYEIRNFKDNNGKLKSRPQNLDYYFKPSVTWSLTGATFAGARYKPYGHIHDVNGMSIFSDDSLRLYLLGFLCSNVAHNILAGLNPTVSNQIGDIGRLPIILSENSGDIIDLVQSNVNIAKQEWDDYEVSWDFTTFPLLRGNECLLSKAIEKYVSQLIEDRNTIIDNESRLNSLFSQIYFIDNDDNNVDFEHVVIQIPSDTDLVKRLLSYSVGVMFGRYSLDVPGLCCAEGYLKGENYSSFIPDSDNIIPINEEEYFGDDIISYFSTFIALVFGEETLEDNLKFISNALNIKGSGTPREKIRHYFLNDFYRDHLQMYHKCPIYWMFDSGKANGFKALIYIHRYSPGLIGKMRKEYLHKMQRFYDDQLKVETDQVRRTSLQKKLDEISRYDLAMELYALKNVEIDLDDGVKHNYALFQNIENSKAANDKINLLYKI